MFFLLDRLKEKLSIACVFILLQRMMFGRTYNVRLLQFWTEVAEICRGGKTDFSGYILDMTWFTGPLCISSRVQACLLECFMKSVF